MPTFDRFKFCYVTETQVQTIVAIADYHSENVLEFELAVRAAFDEPLVRVVSDLKDEALYLGNDSDSEPPILLSLEFSDGDFSAFDVLGCPHIRIKGYFE